MYGRDSVSPALCLLLQVTEKLMQAEEKKLKVLKSEIEAGRHSDSAASSAKVYIQYKTGPQ